MPEARTSPWPEDLFEFAFISPTPSERLPELVALAEEENWTYQRTPSDYPNPVLFNYVRYTYRRVAEENKIALSENGQFSCFNIGPVTPNQEPLYAYFRTSAEKAHPGISRVGFDVGRENSTGFPNCRTCLTISMIPPGA